MLFGCFFNSHFVFVSGKHISFLNACAFGFAVIRYKQSSFRIKNFLGYAYNDTSVLLKCTDSLNNIKYLVSYETGYNRNKGHPDISFKDIDNDEYNKIKDNYQCIEIDEEKANTIRFIKFLYIVGILLLLIIIVRKLLRFT